MADTKPHSSQTLPPTKEHAEATAYLTSLLGRELGIHITDGRIFVGCMKCTDGQRNVVLGNTFEYRSPSPSALNVVATSPAAEDAVLTSRLDRSDMIKRYVGLVVVPGEYITKVELTP